MQEFGRSGNEGLAAIDDDGALQEFRMRMDGIEQRGIVCPVQFEACVFLFICPHHLPQITTDLLVQLRQFGGRRWRLQILDDVDGQALLRSKGLKKIEGFAGFGAAGIVENGDRLHGFQIDIRGEAGPQEKRRRCIIGPRWRRCILPEENFIEPAANFAGLNSAHLAVFQFFISHC